MLSASSYLGDGRRLVEAIRSIDLVTSTIHNIKSRADYNDAHVEYTELQTKS